MAAVEGLSAASERERGHVVRIAYATRDALGRARARRERHVAPWLPEPGA